MMFLSYPGDQVSVIEYGPYLLLRCLKTYCIIMLKDWLLCMSYTEGTREFIIVALVSLVT